MTLHYRYGQMLARVKLGLDAEAASLVNKLEAAVDDESEGHQEYLDMADTAEEAKRPKVEAMARSHAKDELRHHKADSKALRKVD